MPRVIDLLGKRFGKLRVVAQLKERRHGGKKVWLCRCDCGGRATPPTGALTSGNTRSCGCTRGSPSGRGHGHARVGKLTPEYIAWQGIKDRCHNPRGQHWSNYGGRGIKVCGRWRESFAAFLEDVGERPGPDHSIDRKDNDGDYDPRNVRWATRKQQNRNTRRNRVVTHRGQTMTLIEWSEVLGVSYEALRLRLRSGWSIEKTLSTPVRVRKLTREKADEIREAYEVGGETYESLGKRYGVRADYIGKILSGKHWAERQINKGSAP